MPEFVWFCNIKIDSVLSVRSGLARPSPRRCLPENNKWTAICSVRWHTKPAILARGNGSLAVSLPVHPESKTKETHRKRLKKKP
jgi:hypothetical protein